MKKSFLVKKAAPQEPRANIFANRSGLLIHDLLLSNEPEFSIRGLSRATGVSVGLVQRTVKELVYRGFVKASGTRTRKVYRLASPGALLKLWTESYDIREKSRVFTYNSGYSRPEIEEKLGKSRVRDSLVLSLHAAARAQGFSFTNLDTCEYYLLDSSAREKAEKILRLESCDRGYQILLIEPYYSQIVKDRSEEIDGLQVTSALMAFLDLYHFPLRGREQAEHLFRKHPMLKGLCKAFSKEQNGR